MNENATRTDQDSPHARWPCECFYFAVLDTSLLPKGTRVTDEQLGYLFEAELPEPIESLHAIYRRIEGAKYLACGVSTERIANARDALADAVSLTPQTLPPYMWKETLGFRGAETLNLLGGAFEPATIRRLRRRVAMVGLAAVVLAFSTLLLGIERRIEVANDRARSAEVAIARRVDLVLPPASAANPLPPLLRLAAELRTLERTRGVDLGRSGDSGDAVDSLVSLLRAWPTDLPSRTETLVVSESSLHAQTQVASNDRADQLARSLSQLPGWSMDFPRVDAAKDNVRVALSWKRSSAKPRKPR